MNPAMITVRLENVSAVLLNKGDIKMNINKFVSWTSNDDETVIINTLTQNVCFWMKQVKSFGSLF